MRPIATCSAMRGGLVLTSLAVILATPVTAADAQAPPALLSPELQSFAYFLGQWSCAGEFTSSRKPISSKVVFFADLAGSWLVFRWDDNAPNRFHAVEYWGFDRATRHFSNSIYDSAGGMRILDSVGWAADTLLWSHDFPAGGPLVSERFVIERKATDAFVISWDVRRPETEWVTGDRLTCRRE